MARTRNQQPAAEATSNKQQTKTALLVWFNSQWRALKRLEKEDLDFQYAGQWPVSLKIILLVLIFSGVIYACNWLLIDKERTELASAQNAQEALFEQYRVKAFQAANLDGYRQQMASIETTFANLLSRLPAQNEVPRLLEDIHQLAALHRLEIASLTLRPEVPQEFYTELPFEIQVRGDYHRLSNFLAGVTSLNRIITLHNFRMTPTNQGTALNLVIDAKTYRYDSTQQTAQTGTPVEANRRSR